MKFVPASIFSKLVVAASATAMLTGCDEPEYATPTPETSASTSQSTVLVVNAAPGAGDAQLRGVDNTALPTPPAAVPYLGASGYVNNFAAGQRLLSFSTTNNLNNNQIFGRGTFNTATRSTVFLTDLPTRAASGTDPGGVRALVLADNLAAPAAGRTRVRFVNLSPSFASGADSLGLFTITSPSTSGASAPNRFLFAPIGRSYRSIAFTIPAVAATSTAPGRPSRALNFATFTDIPAGNYSFQVRRGIVATNPGEVVIPTTPLTFASGKIYTIYTRGVRNNTATPLGLSLVEHN